MTDKPTKIEDGTEVGHIANEDGYDTDVHASDLDPKYRERLEKYDTLRAALGAANRAHGEACRERNDIRTAAEELAKALRRFTSQHAVQRGRSCKCDNCIHAGTALARWKEQQP